MNFRTDLAAEAHEISRGEAKEIEGVAFKSEFIDETEIITVEVLNEKGSKKIGKSIGKYITINAPDIKYSLQAYKRTSKAIAAQIKALADCNKNKLTLVVGLGNYDITPDRIGNLTVGKIMVTNHLKKYMPDVIPNDISSVCAIAPGVLGTTGMESADIIKSISDELKPNLIIAVDALAAADCSRIGTTVQLTDAGIQPGSGVGNNRNALSKECMGIPVVAIGVPTVTDASCLTGTEEDDMFMVTPRDIDLIVEKCSNVIAGGINLALQENMTLEEIEEYVG